jgi:hypothetical protein
MRTAVMFLIVALLAAGCSSVQESAQGLRDRITDIDIDETLEGLRDCDRLSDTFVGVVQTAADTVDSLSERTDGRVPVTDIRRAVDAISVSQYFDIAERIGCAEVQQRLNTVDQLRGLVPDTPAGQDFIEEVLNQVEAQR